MLLTATWHQFFFLPVILMIVISSFLQLACHIIIPEIVRNCHSWYMDYSYNLHMRGWLHNKSKLANRLSNTYICRWCSILYTNFSVLLYCFNNIFQQVGYVYISCKLVTLHYVSHINNYFYIAWSWVVP